MTTPATGIVDEIHAIATKIAPFAALLQTLEGATGLGGPPAAVAIAVIKAGVDALATQGQLGTVTADEVIANYRGILAKLTADEASDDAEADAIVAGRRLTP